MTSKTLTVILIIAGLLLTALIARNGDLAWLTLPFLLYLGTGILRAPDPGEIRLLATRTVRQTRMEGATLAEIRVLVRNEGAAIDRLVLTDDIPREVKITEGQNGAVVALGAGEEVAFQYICKTGRGIFHWEAVRALASDPLGLIEIKLALPAEEEMEVQPALQKFRHIPLRPRHTLQAAGPIPARRAGIGTDFWGVREYHPGDSLRWLDWRLTARHPRKFYTKEFEEEEIADIGLILDAREITNLRHGDESLFEHSIEAAAALAEVFLRENNRVSMMIYGESILRLFPGYGKAHLNRILRTLARATAGSSGSLSSLDYLPVRLFPKHAFIVIISPLAPNDWQFFTRLRAHGYEVMLISPDPVDFTAPMLSPDPANDLAVRAARIERRLQLKRIAQMRIPVVDWQVQRPLSGIVHEALIRTNIQRKPA